MPFESQFAGLVIFEIRQQISHLLVVNLQIAHRHLVGAVILSLEHLVEKVLDGQVAEAEILELLVLFCLWGYLLLLLAGDPTELSQHGVGFARASHAIGEAAHIIAV